jgi:prepilin-type N-terminal cleavage/methylation domain-containing protein
MKTIRKSGYTLVEALIAIAILAGALGGIYTSIVTLKLMTNAAHNHIEAQGIAFDEAWEVFNMPYHDLVNYSSPNTRAVESNSCLYSLGGTLRTAVLSVSNRCNIIVRVDWNQRTAGGEIASSESYSISRYETKR